jgi:hypothetical protein
MAERIVKVVCFALVASFCGLVGGIALYFLNHDISADLKAQRVRQAITQLKDLGPRIEEFRRSHNRLPTDSEVFCELRPCGRDGLLTVRLVPEVDGSFTLIHSSLGVMFTPLQNMNTTWHSRDGKTDRDGWDQVWRWHLRYLAIALVDVIVILLPWLWLIVLRLDKRWPPRPRPRRAIA